MAVGVAYLNWADTDMIRDGDRHQVLHGLRSRMPFPAHRIQSPQLVAARLARAVERRRTAVYVPAWLRLVQPVRAALPSVVLRYARRELPRMAAEQPLLPTGPLGAGGRADERRRNSAHPDDR